MNSEAKNHQNEAKDYQAVLDGKIIVKGKIKLLTGLHIGGTNSTVQIGGIDASVVRNPITQEPYIPGSSLKGKIRCLLEQHYGLLGPSQGNIQFGPCNDSKEPIVRLFGTSDKENPHPSLVIFRDCYLLDAEKLFKNKHTDLPYTEAKTEVVIDRIRGTATPRQIERVPAGVEFGFEIIVNIWKRIKGFEEMFLEREEALKILAEGMRLLELDYLGGKGTRGSGQVKFVINNIEEYLRDMKVPKEENVEKYKKIFIDNKIELT